MKLDIQKKSSKFPGNLQFTETLENINTYVSYMLTKTEAI